MKICIPVKDNNAKESIVHDHFGSAPGFMIHCTRTGETTYVENDNQHHEHGMCQPMNLLAEQMIDMVVCMGMGMRAVQKLNEAGIKAYRAEGRTVQDIIDKVAKDALQEITIQNACTQHNCH
jgi:predicted Fe-Mo cluster-binding NifX family protein